MAGAFILPAVFIPGANVAYSVLVTHYTQYLLLLRKAAAQAENVCAEQNHGITPLSLK